jgi:hypothetical protein
VLRRSTTLRALRAGKLTLGGLAWLAVAALAGGPGCGTDAKGIEDCREIEQARCAAAVPCGIVPDEEKCKIFYRDHCLHGMAGNPPEQAYIDLCVNTINKLGTCAKAGGPKAELADCGVRASGATTVCDVVQFPERAEACQFLSSKPPPASSAGQGGAAGSE